MTCKVEVGLERSLIDPPKVLASGARFGLLMNQASVTAQFEYACDVLQQRFPGQLKSIFAPQHGLWCEQQANMIETAHAHHLRLDVPIYSLYAELREPTAEMLAGIDVFVIDLQDVGTRVYTFAWTVVNCLRACAQRQIPVLLFDRPNPIGGTCVEGPILDSRFRSFVGLADIPMRHALTLGELALVCNRSLSIGAKLDVVRLTGWSRDLHLPQLDVPWCAPSPNMPSYATALVYPGQVLLEGTNLSEGRGTTTPFEVLGAPFIDGEVLAEQLNSRALAGVHFRPLNFVPTFDKWQGQRCGGVFIHVIRPLEYRSYRATLEILWAVKQQWPDDFSWLPPPYEYERIKPPIDILSGSDQLRLSLEDGDSVEFENCCRVDATNWWEATAESLLYG